MESFGDFVIDVLRAVECWQTVAMLAVLAYIVTVTLILAGAER